MAQVLKPTPVAQVDANGRIQAHSGGTSRLWSHPQARSGGNCTLGLKSMAQVLKPTPVAQADSDRNLKSAPAAKLLVFSDFLFALAFRKVLFRFLHLKSTPRGTKLTIVVAYQVRSAWHLKVDF
jgi:hypothetical protein